MPNVNVLKKELLDLIGGEYTNDEFEDLCFQFGVECEFGDAKEQQMTRTDDKGQDVDITKEQVYKIEVAANRYDLLCLEGIAAAFRCYLGKQERLPRYQIREVSYPLQKIIVKPETAAVRPYVVGCVLRDVNFTLASYNSFIDLQDKLHQNICRRRQLASMGTHDLDKIQGPITYEAVSPADIKFQALKQTQSMSADKLCELYKTDNVMKKFLPILDGHDKFPVFYDANRQVLSLPPLINSNATKITCATKNVFVEITAMDLQKAKICLAIMAAQFSTHCAGEWQHKCEQVEIVYENTPNMSKEVTPTMTYNNFDVEVDYINRVLGLQLNTEQIKACATKMGIEVKQVVKNGDKEIVKVEVPPTRADILHPCDIMEDIGIGWGYNNIPNVFPPTNTVGSFQPANKFQDLLRNECAQAGYIECLTSCLISQKNNYLNLRLPVDTMQCVTLANPKTLEYEIVRTSMIPGLLMTLQENKKESIPQKVFEISDCCVLQPGSETGARNVRKICCMVLDSSANLEVIQGMVELIMEKTGSVGFQDAHEQKKGHNKVQNFKLVADNSDPRWMPGRGAHITLNGRNIGHMGVLHPEVLDSFELKYPVTCLELDFDAVFGQFTEKDFQDQEFINSLYSHKFM